jgi:hydrogenase-4 component B
VLLAAACVAIGLLPLLFWPAVAAALAAWQPAVGVVPAPASLGTLSAAQIAIALAVVLAGLALWRWTRRAQRIGPTWDCGYVAPTSRMQYTAGSFAATLTEWFGWILRPHRQVDASEALLPARAAFASHTPETVLEHVIEPAGKVVLQAALAVRRLQHGELQTYLLYLLAGIAALGGLVMIGGPQ